MPDDDQIAQKSGSECTNVTIYVNKEKKIGNVMLTSSFNKVVEQVQVHLMIHGFLNSSFSSLSQKKLINFIISILCKYLSK